MKQYIQLTNEEIKRSFKLYMIVVLAMVAIELVSVVAQVMLHEQNIKNFMENNRATLSEALQQIGKLDYADTTSFFVFMTLIGIVFVVIYAFQIWYRDWLGETKYIYRLLMLPGRRYSIFFSKLTAVFLVMISFIGLQWCFLKAGSYLFDWSIQAEYQKSSNTNIFSSSLEEFYTTNLTNMIFIILISTMIVCLIFLLVLLERSHRKVKGLIRVAIETTIFVSYSFICLYFLDQTHLLLSSEKDALFIGFVFVYMIYACWRSLRLLKWKISV